MQAQPGAGFELLTVLPSMSACLQASRTPNGVAGFKAMWHDLSTKKITPNQWPDDAIPVRLTRRDRDRQAVSWAKAEQSGDRKSVV